MKKVSKGFSSLKDSKNKERVRKIRERELRKKTHKAESSKIKKISSHQDIKSPKRMTGGSGKPTIAGVTTHTR